ncbi:pilus assembly protein PilM [Chloroflexota bacterium]
MAKQVVTLHVDDASVRLLVTKGKAVKKWAELPLESGLVKDGVVLDKETVASRVKGLLKTQKVQVSKVVAGLSGLHCISRLIALPRLPKSLLNEAVTREAERVLPVPLEQLYLSWQTIPVPGEELLIFLVALPRKAADALVNTLRLAGIDPYLMDLKPLALARVVDRATAIIADVQPTEIDIVVTVDRVPQVIRTIALPGVAQTEQKNLALLKEELDRTISFYNSSHPEMPLDPEIPIFVSGELVKESETEPTITGKLSPFAVPLSSPLKYLRWGLPPSRYMVNVGLALKEVPLPETKATSSRVNLNVLPEVYRPKQRSVKEIIFVPTIMLIVAVLVPLVTMVQSAIGNTASLQNQLDTTNQVIIKNQKEKKEIDELQKTASGIEAARKALAGALNNFAAQQDNVNEDLQTVTSLASSSIILNGISYNGKYLVINGAAPDELVILEYARELRSSGRFSQVIVSSISSSTDEMSFNFSIKK